MHLRKGREAVTTLARQKALPYERRIATAPADGGMTCLLRHVRDTGANDHTAPRLLGLFGRSLMVRALAGGLIERQGWQGHLTNWVDLTAKGEAFLVETTRVRRS
jgi:hypothetical protein